MPIFTITKRVNGDFQFNLKANNGEVILTSQGYSSKASCHIGIASVKANTPFAERFERKIAMNGQYYFNLTAANGFVIGTSEMYQSVAARDSGIESVKQNAPQAKVEDLG